MKRLSTTLLTCILLIAALPVPTFASNIRLTFNGNTLNSQVPPVMQKGTTFVPLRVIADSLGASTNYSKTSSNEYIEIAQGDNVIKLAIKEEQGYPTVNGSSIDFKVLPIIIKGTTLVPVRFVSEQLGLDVNYVSSTNTVAISTKDYIPSPSADVPAEKITIKIDGKTIIPEVKPFFENGYFYVPVSVAENFGASVYADYMECGFRRKDILITMEYQENATKVNWILVPNKASAIRRPNQTFIPLKFVAETLNCDVKFDIATNTYNITSKGLIKVDLSTERYNDIKGYIKYMDGNPAKNIEVHFVPMLADGRMGFEEYYKKHNDERILPVKTDNDGFYIFEAIDTSEFPFIQITVNKDTNERYGEWRGRTPCEIDPDLLNNVPSFEGPVSPRVNAKRLWMPTFYIEPNPYQTY